MAALVGITIHAISVLVYGPESLAAFFAAVTRLQTDVVGLGLRTPPKSMTTVFGQVRDWGLSGDVAMNLQYISAVMVFGLVGRVWRRHAQDEAQSLYLAALVCTGAILVTPYAYAYEMAVLAPAAIWLALCANRFRVHAPLIFTGFWLILVLRRFLPRDFILQAPFWITLVAFCLLIFGAFGRKIAIADSRC